MRLRLKRHSFVGMTLRFRGTMKDKKRPGMAQKIHSPELDAHNKARSAAISQANTICLNKYSKTYDRVDADDETPFTLMWQTGVTEDNKPCIHIQAIGGQMERNINIGMLHEFLEEFKMKNLGQYAP